MLRSGRRRASRFRADRCAFSPLQKPSPPPSSPSPSPPDEQSSLRSCGSVGRRGVLRPRSRAHTPVHTESLRAVAARRSRAEWLRSATQPLVRAQGSASRASLGIGARRRSTRHGSNGFSTRRRRRRSTSPRCKTPSATRVGTFYTTTSDSARTTRAAAPPSQPPPTVPTCRTFSAPILRGRSVYPSACARAAAGRRVARHAAGRLRSWSGQVGVPTRSRPSRPTHAASWTPYNPGARVRRSTTTRPTSIRCPSRATCCVPASSTPIPSATRC